MNSFVVFLSLCFLIGIDLGESKRFRREIQPDGESGEVKRIQPQHEDKNGGIQDSYFDFKDSDDEGKSNFEEKERFQRDEFLRKLDRLLPHRFLPYSNGRDQLYKNQDSDDAIPILHPQQPQILTFLDKDAKRSAPNSGYMCHFKLCQFGSSGKRLYNPTGSLRRYTWNGRDQ